MERPVPHPQLAYSASQTVRRDRLLRLPAVETATGFRKSTIYAWVKAGKFPPPVQITPRCVAWPESRLLQWVQDQIAAADGTASSAEAGNNSASDGAP